MLQALVDAGTALPLRDLARRVGMSSAKAHPYLVSFGKLGLIEQDALTLPWLVLVGLALGLSLVAGGLVVNSRRRAYQAIRIRIRK